MSDIPLHTLRRYKHQPEEPGIVLTPDTGTMPAKAASKAVPDSRRNRDYRRDRYADDSEEEQGLLGSPSYDDSDEYNGRRPPTTPVSGHYDLTSRPADTSNQGCGNTLYYSNLPSQR